MSFNPNIPLVTDPLPQSFTQLRSNFNAIAKAFSSNHTPLTGSIPGKHSVITLRPIQAPLTDPVTSATEIAINNKLVGGTPELFFWPSSAQPSIKLTYPSLLTGIQSTNPDVYFPAQYSFIAGPFVIYGGLITAPVDGQVVTLLPATTLIYATVLVTNLQRPTVNSVTTTNLSGSSFTIASSIAPSNGYDLYYFAVGV